MLACCLGSAGCDKLGHGHEEDALDGAAELEPHVRDAVEACQAWRAAQPVDPVPAPAHVLECGSADGCVLALTPREEASWIGSATQILLEGAALDPVVNHDHGLELVARERTSGAIDVLDHARWTWEPTRLVFDWQTRSGHYDLYARYASLCPGLPAGMALLGDVDIDTLTEAPVLRFDAASAVTVSGALRFVGAPEDVARFERALWGISLVPAGAQPQRDLGPITIDATTHDGRFELEAFPGTYDVYGAYLHPLDLPLHTCLAADYGETTAWAKLASAVTVEAGRHLELELEARPILISGEVVPGARLPEPLPATVSVVLQRHADTDGTSGSRLLRLKHGQPFAVVSWPGEHALCLEALEPPGLPGCEGGPWQRLERLELEASAHVELPLDAAEVRVAVAAAGASSLDDVLGERWLEARWPEEDARWQRPEYRSDAADPSRVLLPPGQAFELELHWEGGGEPRLARGWGALASLAPLGGDADLGARVVPEAAAFALTVRAAPRDRAGSRPELVLRDPVAGRWQELGWLDDAEDDAERDDAGLVRRQLTRRVLGGVQDLHWEVGDGLSWVLAACVPIGAETPTLALEPAWRTLRIELPRRNLDALGDLHYRLLASADGLTPPWPAAAREPILVPYDQLGDTSPYVELTLLPGTWELWPKSPDVYDPVIVEVR